MRLSEEQVLDGLVLVLGRIDQAPQVLEHQHSHHLPAIIKLLLLTVQQRLARRNRDVRVLGLNALDYFVDLEVELQHHQHLRAQYEQLQDRRVLNHLRLLLNQVIDDPRVF